MEFGHLRDPEVQEQLLRVPPAPSAKDERFKHRLSDALAFLGHGHMRAQRAVDLARLVEEDLDHHAVHRVVPPEEPHRLDPLGGLPIAVHAPFALFESVRIPGQVVVHDRRELLLEIHAFGEAVGRHEHARAVSVNFGNLGLAFVVAKAPGHTDHLGIGR